MHAERLGRAASAAPVEERPPHADARDAELGHVGCEEIERARAADAGLPEQADAGPRRRLDRARFGLGTVGGAGEADALGPPRCHVCLGQRGERSGRLGVEVRQRERSGLDGQSREIGEHGEGGAASRLSLGNGLLDAEPLGLQRRRVGRECCALLRLPLHDPEPRVEVLGREREHVGLRIEEERAEERLGRGFAEPVERDGYAGDFLGIARFLGVGLSGHPLTVVERPIRLHLRTKLLSRRARHGLSGEVDGDLGHRVLHRRLPAEGELGEALRAERSQPQPGRPGEEVRLHRARVLLRGGGSERAEPERIRRHGAEPAAQAVRRPTAGG